MTLVTSVGGASGPLYGTFFLRAAAAAGDATTLDGAGAARGAARRARGHRRPRQGRGRRQDDVRRPRPRPRRLRVHPGRRRPTSRPPPGRRPTAAADGRDATEPLQALKGRASYLGERSIGHIDPGAASSALLVAALADSVGLRGRRHDRHRRRLPQPCPGRRRGRAGRRDGPRPRAGVAVAAGAAGGFGTDATEVAAALAKAASPDGVLVLMDLGSAVLSAELGARARAARTAPVRLCPAPLVEGLVAAVVARRRRRRPRRPWPGRPRPRCCPRRRAWPSTAHGAAGAGPRTRPRAPDASARLTLLNPLGLHARPAAQIATAVGEPRRPTSPSSPAASAPTPPARSSCSPSARARAPRSPSPPPAPTPSGPSPPYATWSLAGFGELD